MAETLPLARIIEIQDRIRLVVPKEVSSEEPSPDLTENIETLEEAQQILGSPDITFELYNQLSIKLPYLEARAKVRARERVHAAVTNARIDAKKVTTLDGQMDGSQYLMQEVPDKLSSTGTTPLFYFLTRKFNHDFGFGLVIEPSKLPHPRRR